MNKDIRHLFDDQEKDWFEENCKIQVRVPDYVVQMVRTKTPAREYQVFQENWPDLIPYLIKDSWVPVSWDTFCDIVLEVTNG